MELLEILNIKKHINSKIEKGDYITLAKMLEVREDAARKRYLRANEEAVCAMRDIVESRQALIESHKGDQHIGTINGLPEGFAVLDCSVSKSLKNIVVMITNKSNYHIVFETPDQMDKAVHLFVEKVVSKGYVSAIITDCSIGYLPTVKAVIHNYKLKHYYKHHYASRSENYIKLLSLQN